MIFFSFVNSALKKMNEKKQVFNMYKTQKAKEEKVHMHAVPMIKVHKISAILLQK